MSLLIKALDKAEKDQARHGKTTKAEASQSSDDWSLEAIHLELGNINVNKAAPTLGGNIAVGNSNSNAGIDEDSLAEFNETPLLVKSERIKSERKNQGYLANGLSDATQDQVNKTQDYQSKAKKTQVQQTLTEQDNARLVQQGQAANVFSAKRTARDSKKIMLLSVVSLLGLLLLGTGLYSYLGKPVEFAKPRFVQAPAQVLSAVSVAPTQAEPIEASQLPVVQPQVNVRDIQASAPTASMLSANESLEKNQRSDQQLIPVQSKTEKKTPGSDVDLSKPIATAKLDAASLESVNPAPKNSKRLIASQSASVTVTKNKQEAGVSPTLLNAYQAFSVGEDTKAQQLYKQVLQNEIRNVDAMLGLAAIAQRQSRVDDASGWYRKVLELDPKNAIAQSSLINAQMQSGGQEDGVASESRLKNLIAQQPENASVQAALGSLYADQNQWASAQQAYFEAHRLAPASADFTFNLAASLDQMGKPKLALPYYKRTLELLAKSGNSSVDESALRARIKVIE